MLVKHNFNDHKTEIAATITITITLTLEQVGLNMTDCITAPQGE